MKKEDQGKLNKIEDKLAEATLELKRFNESIDLIKQAETYGYRNGNYLCLFDPSDTQEIGEGPVFNTEVYGQVWIEDEDGNSNCIYNKVVWAEIIKDELRLNGQEVKVLNGHISISNATFTVKSFKELTNELLNMGMTNVNHPAFGHVSVSEMQKVCDQIKPF